MRLEVDLVDGGGGGPAPDLSPIRLRPRRRGLGRFARRRYARDHLPLGAATLIGTGIPLLYYAILGKVDTNWKLAQIASKHGCAAVYEVD